MGGEIIHESTSNSFLDSCGDRSIPERDCSHFCIPWATGSIRETDGIRFTCRRNHRLDSGIVYRKTIVEGFQTKRIISSDAQGMSYLDEEDAVSIIFVRCHQYALVCIHGANSNHKMRCRRHRKRDRTIQIILWFLDGGLLGSIFRSLFCQTDRNIRQGKTLQEWT